MNSPSPEPLAIVPSVLVLEDNEAYRALIAEVLADAGFEVHTAANGRGITALLANHRIDLLITDLSMPERDGLETMTGLRYSHPHLPVIAISGDVPLNRELYLTLAEKLGAARVLAKPFKMAELIAAARAAIAASAAAKSGP